MYMKAFFASVLAGSLLFLGLSFAGMLFSGMTYDSGMYHEDVPVSADCVDHCVDAASVATPVTSAMLLLPVLLSGFVTLFLSSIFSHAHLSSVFYRWREGIGKYFLHQQLSVVVIRD